MKHTIKNGLFALAAVVGFGALLFAAPSAYAIDALDNACQSGADSVVCDNQDDDVNSVLQTVVNTLLFIVGAVSVIVIIISGITFATANGDATSVTKAKNALLYAVIGLIVALVAYAIINFVVGQFAPRTTGGGGM